MTEKLKILIVDDHAVVRKGLQSFLEMDAAYEVIGEAGSGEESVQKARELNPDIILMDVRMPGINGIEACRLILEEQPQIKVVMLTSYTDDESVLAAILAGAKGYILKRVDTDIFMQDLVRIARGESLLDPAVTQQIFEKIRTMARSGSGDETVEALEHLTAQEKRILTLIAEGKTNKEIASEIFISAKTVRNYVTNILAKLNLSNRTQAATFAANLGLVHKNEK